MKFSILDFDKEIINKDDEILRLFKFVDKHLLPSGKEIKYLIRNKKFGLTECRTEVRYYDLDITLDYIDNIVTSCGTRQKQYIPTWIRYKKILNSLRAGPIHEKVGNKAI